MAAPPNLDLLKENLRRLRAIYAALTAVGLAGCGGVALYVTSGGTLEGAAIAACIAAPCLLLVGSVFLLPKLRIEGSPVVLLLTNRPQQILRISRKRTESSIAGVNAASYEWIVLWEKTGRRHEIWVQRDDLAAVFQEIRNCAPHAEVDPTLTVQRMNVRL